MTKAYVVYGSSTGLSDSPSWTAEVSYPETYYASIMWFGMSVACAGDVNQDGYSDIIVGAPEYWNGDTNSDTGELNNGKVFIYYGSPTGLESTASWTTVSNQGDTWFGISVASAGDVNSDGYSDIIVGEPAYSNGQTYEGRAYLYYGAATEHESDADSDDTADDTTADETTTDNGADDDGGGGGGGGIFGVVSIKDLIGYHLDGVTKKGMRIYMPVTEGYKALKGAQTHVEKFTPFFAKVIRKCFESLERKAEANKEGFLYKLGTYAFPVLGKIAELYLDAVGSEELMTKAYSGTMISVAEFNNLYKQGLAISPHIVKERYKDR